MRWKSLSVIIAGALMVALLAACGGNGDEPAATEAPVATAVDPGTGGTTTTQPDDTTTQPDDSMTQPDDSMVMPDDTMMKPEPVLGGTWDYERGTPDLHDPYFLRGGPSDLNIFNSLIQMKFPFNPAEGIQFEPVLAESYTVSEDGSKWRFKLREGVTWHDGEAFNADDVIATTERLLDPDFIVQPLQVTIRRVLDSVTKIGDYEVEFDTGTADATALSYFRSHYFLQVPEHLIAGTKPRLLGRGRAVDEAGHQRGTERHLRHRNRAVLRRGLTLDTEMNMFRNENYLPVDDEGRAGAVPGPRAVPRHPRPDSPDGVLRGWEQRVQPGSSSRNDAAGRQRAVPAEQGRGLQDPEVAPRLRHDDQQQRVDAGVRQPAGECGAPVRPQRGSTW